MHRAWLTFTGCHDWFRASVCLFLANVSSSARGRVERPSACASGPNTSHVYVCCSKHKVQQILAACQAWTTHPPCRWVSKHTLSVRVTWLNAVHDQGSPAEQGGMAAGLMAMSGAQALRIDPSSAGIRRDLLQVQCCIGAGPVAPGALQQLADARMAAQVKHRPPRLWAEQQSPPVCCPNALLRVSRTSSWLHACAQNAHGECSPCSCTSHHLCVRARFPAWMKAQ